MASILLGYWPKFFSAAIFAIINVAVASRHLNSRRYILERLVTGYLISPSFISIWGECLTVYIYNYFADNVLSSDPHNLIFISSCIVADIIFVFLGGMCFSYCTGMWGFKGATVYMEFVCIERLCMVVAVDSITYVVLYIFFVAALFICFRKEAQYLVHCPSIKWKNIFIYLAGLFYILDLLYSAYYIFAELGTNVVNVQNVVWLDVLALITTGFAMGYMKVEIAEAREHDEKIEYFNRLQASQEDIIITLAEISEAKSGETGQHVRRVAEYSKLLAAKLGLSLFEVETIKIAAMMHDLGKLMISQEIIEKPGRLTEEEYIAIKEHSQYGWDILSNSKGEIIEMARLIALEHHEYWNGKGYPNGLKENQISIYAQIVSVADVFDALTSKRSYKESWSLEDAKAEIIRQRGEQFSPKVVDAFIENFDGITAIKSQYIDE